MAHPNFSTGKVFICLLSGFTRTLSTWFSISVVGVGVLR
jgi:hypothetical protein